MARHSDRFATPQLRRPSARSAEHHETRRRKFAAPVDEPSDLPDGAEVEIVVIDDALTPEARAELHASLDRALDDSDAGRGQGMPRSSSRSTGHVVKLVRLAEAQRRLEVEDAWWRDYRDREHDLVEIHFGALVEGAARGCETSLGGE